MANGIYPKSRSKLLMEVLNKHHMDLTILMSFTCT